MATLNFPDDLLLKKTCGDICECVASNHRPAVIGSILTSLGLLRYKNAGKCQSFFCFSTFITKPDYRLLHFVDLWVYTIVLKEDTAFVFRVEVSMARILIDYMGIGRGFDQGAQEDGQL
jgi:hypothetical protein